MNDTTPLTETALLAIPTTEPERLFPGTLVEAKELYRKLAGRWHPDKNPVVGHKVFAHVQVLYEEATKRIVDGTWRAKGILHIKDTQGREFFLRYRKSRPFELGQMYLGDTIVAWSLELGYEDLVHNALNTLKREVHYENDAMRKEHERHLPKILEVVRVFDKIIVVMHKSQDQFLLRDVLEHVGGKMDSRHVAWIVSSLLNINCYLNFTGVVHQAISPDTYFISPATHAGTLLGGWWYAAGHGQRIRAVPARTLLYGPYDLADKRIALRETDSALIRATARELLGDGVGSRLLMDKSVPKPLLDWLRGAGEEQAYTEYHTWYHKVLKDAFGARRFVQMAISPSDIYKE